MRHRTQSHTLRARWRCVRAGAVRMRSDYLRFLTAAELVPSAKSPMTALMVSGSCERSAHSSCSTLNCCRSAAPATNGANSSGML